MSVYKVVEIIGTSSESWEDAALTAIKKATRNHPGSCASRKSSSSGPRSRRRRLCHCFCTNSRLFRYEDEK